MPQESAYDPVADAARRAWQCELTAAGDTPVIERAISYIKDHHEGPLRILDAGCGAGVATVAHFSEYDAVVLGVDRSAEAVMHARRLAQHRVQMRFVVAELEEFDPGSVTYDLVFCSMVLHLAKDPQALVNRLWSLVAPGGVLVIRGLDDGLDLCWPDSEDSRIIAELTPIVFSEVNRRQGRTMPLMMSGLGGLANLEIAFPAITTLGRPGVAGQLVYFEVAQGWKSAAVMSGANRSEERQGMLRELEKAVANERERFASEEVFASSCMVTVSAYKVLGAAE